MTTLAITNTFVANTRAESAKVNANFTDVVTWANGNVDNTNIKTAAAIAVNKLAAVTVSRALVSDASGFIAASTVSTTQLQYLASATGTTGTTSTNLVFSTSPTLVTPNLGTPSTLVGTNITGTAAGLTAGTVTTNANLTGDVTSVGNATTLATVNANTGAWGSSTAIPVITLNAKGLATAASTAAVIAPAGTLTGTTLASNVVTSSLTSVGTIATGVWNGTAIGATYGGTGGSSAASTGLAKVAAGTWSYATLVNADVDAAAAITRSKLASGTNYRILANNSTGVMSENAALTAARVVYADANGQLTGASGFSFDGTSLTVSGVVGTATNNNATAGNVGEFTSVNSPTGGTATPGSSGTYVNVASISLTAGDWDVYGTNVVNTGATSAITRIYTAISKSSAADDVTYQGNAVDQRSSAFPVSSFLYQPTVHRRVSLASTTTIYLVSFMTYSVLGGATYYSDSYLSARRAR